MKLHRNVRNRCGGWESWDGYKVICFILCIACTCTWRRAKSVHICYKWQRAKWNLAYKLSSIYCHVVLCWEIAFTAECNSYSLSFTLLVDNTNFLNSIKVLSIKKDKDRKKLIELGLKGKALSKPPLIHTSNFVQTKEYCQLWICQRTKRHQGFFELGKILPRQG